ncbi:helix-turn-helix domain-containing protein [Halonotius sp. F2-221B]
MGDRVQVADTLGCATSTAAEHLRKAERNLMTEFVGLADHDR